MNLPARKTYVKRRTQSSKGLCHLHLLCRRKRTLASGLLQRTGGKENARMKAGKGKRLSQRLSVTRQKLARSFHIGQPKITRPATGSRQSCTTGSPLSINPAAAFCRTRATTFFYSTGRKPKLPSALASCHHSGALPTSNAS